MGNTAQDVVPGLGTLHRACIWENILLKAGLAARGIDTTTSPDASSPEEPSTVPSVPLSGTQNLVTANGIQLQPLNPEDSLQTENSKGGGAREHNAKALQHLTHGLPSSLAPFFQGCENFQVNRAI